jgi:hypothetical protein
MDGELDITTSKLRPKNTALDPDGIHGRVLAIFPFKIPASIEIDFPWIKMTKRVIYFDFSKQMSVSARNFYCFLLEYERPFKLSNLVLDRFVYE